MELQETKKVTRADEGRVFAFLSILLAPIVAIGLVGSYGFAIWIYQILNGPTSG
jgi:nitrate reductase NapE